MEKSNDGSNSEISPPTEHLIAKSTSQQNSDKKWLLPSLIGLVIIALGIAGYFAYQNFQLKREQPNLSQPTLTPNSDISSPTTDPATTRQTTQVINNKQLFISHSIDRFKIQLYLYNQDTNIIKSKVIDFAQTGWDINLPSSRFNTILSSEPVQYNPITEEVILVATRIPWGIGSKPDNALPEAPFSYAIFKTNFNEADNSLIQLFTSSDIEPQPHPLYIALNPINNQLFVETISYTQDKSKPIYSLTAFNLKTAEQSPYPIYQDVALNVDRSNIQISSDGRKLNQLIIWPSDSSKNQILKLYTLNLEDRTHNTLEIIRGDSIDTDLSSLSHDGNKITFYANGKLYYYDIANNELFDYSLNSNLGNGNLYMSNDATRILYGAKQNNSTLWKYYDIPTQKTYSTLAGHPLTWNTNNNVVFYYQNAIVLYNPLTDEEYKLNINNLSDPSTFKSVQWR